MKKSDSQQPRHGVYVRRAQLSAAKKSVPLKKPVISRSSDAPRGLTAPAPATAPGGKASLAIYIGLPLGAFICFGVVILAASHLFGADFTRFLRWLTILLLPGFAVYPLSARLFRRHPQVAFLFSLPLGLLLGTFPVWTLAYLHLAPFHALTIYLTFAALALLFYALPSTRRAAFDALRPRGGKALGFSFASIAFFAAALCAMCFVRGLMPAAHDLEKFMDYGFMMSLWRSDYLPAADIWFAGQPINYYYYGQYIYSFLARASGLPPAYAYNLGLGACFAYFCSLTFAVGYLICSLFCRGRQPKNASLIRRFGHSAFPILGGALSTLFTTIAGNAHDFFIGPQAPARALLQRLTGGDPRYGDLLSYRFPDATRYIGYNPPTHDKTIHEFPCYSFLVGDLHAHLANTIFVLLYLALLLLLATGTAQTRHARTLRSPRRLLYSHPAGYPFDGPAAEANASAPLRLKLLRSLLRAYVSDALLPLLSLALGVFIMGNYWDFPIYFVVLAFFLFFALKRGVGAELTISSFPLFVLQIAFLFIPYLLIVAPLPQLLGLLLAVFLGALLYLLQPTFWTSLGVQLGLTFALAHFWALPFDLRLLPLVKRLVLAQNHTPFWQFLILYGPQLLIMLLFLLALLLMLGGARRRDHARVKALTSADDIVEGEANRVEAEKDPLAGTLSAPENEKAPLEETSPPPVATKKPTNPHTTVFPTEGRRYFASVSGSERVGGRRQALLPERYRREAERQRNRSTAVSQLEPPCDKRPRFTIFRRLTPADFILFLLFLCALGLLLAPEIFYLVDIYGQDYARANTMFKFTYQAFILLGIALPCAALRLFGYSAVLFKRRQSRREDLRNAEKLAAEILTDQTAGTPLSETVTSERIARGRTKRRLLLETPSAPGVPTLVISVLAGILSFLLLLPLLMYPIAATWHWIPEPAIDNFKGLDASAWLAVTESPEIKMPGSRRLLRDDLAAIDWLNENVSGQPVILEAAGPSYTDYARISSFTGLPTIIGWQTHEWLWRSAEQPGGSSAYTMLIAPRQNDVKQIYEGKNKTETLRLLALYHVRYIIVGDMERSLYGGLNEKLIDSLGPVVFSHGTLRIIHLPNS